MSTKPPIYKLHVIRDELTGLRRHQEYTTEIYSKVDLLYSFYFKEYTQVFNNPEFRMIQFVQDDVMYHVTKEIPLPEGGVSSDLIFYSVTKDGLVPTERTKNSPTVSKMNTELKENRDYHDWLETVDDPDDSQPGFYGGETDPIKRAIIRQTHKREKEAQSFDKEWLDTLPGADIMYAKLVGRETYEAKIAAKQEILKHINPEGNHYVNWIHEMTIDYGVEDTVHSLLEFHDHSTDDKCTNLITEMKGYAYKETSNIVLAVLYLFISKLEKEMDE